MVDIVGIVAATYLCGTWVAGACVAALALIWRVIPKTEGPPTLQLAMTAQWVAVSCGVFYTTLSGRELEATIKSDWVPMVLIGLGCVTVLSIGIWVGQKAVCSVKEMPEAAPEETVPLRTLVIVYAIGVVVTGAMQSVAFVYPVFTQAILALSMIRLALIYLMLRRFARPDFRWELIIALLGFEVALGFTGFFSSFKEPLLLAALVVLERFDRRQASHWLASGLLGASLVLMLMMWISVRSEFRGDFDDEAFASSRTVRLERMEALSSDWVQQASGRSLTENLGALVDRAWVIYYPALAVARVPALIPHTDGQLMWDTVVHLVTPRILFPDKPELPSDSEFVRKYSGVYVAGVEQNTTIAFGYAAESYVDFGVPWMFVPVFIFGVFVGASYEWFLRTIVHRELAIAFVTATFWTNLYMFERAWSKTLGFTLTMMIYVGGLVFLVDRWLLWRQEAAAHGDAHGEPLYGER